MEREYSPTPYFLSLGGSITISTSLTARLEKL